MPSPSTSVLRSLSYAAQGFRLPARSIQRVDQQRPEPLAQRILTHEQLELRNRRVLEAETQLQFDARLERGHPQALEASDLGPRPRRVGESVERRPPPPGQRTPVLANAVGPGQLRPFGAPQRVLELGRVELAGFDTHHVPRNAGHEPVGGQDLAQLADVSLQRVDRRRGRTALPEVVNQPVGGNHRARAQQQHRQEGSRLRRRDLPPPGFVDDLERSQNAESDHLPCPA